MTSEERLRPTKRARKLITENQPESRIDTLLPLRDVVACLTGLPQEKKEEYHCLIERLGGRYTRELLSDETTHLIALTKQGAKYDLAASCSHICIVTPEWLESCDKTQSRVKEKDFLLDGEAEAGRPGIVEAVDEQLQKWNKLEGSSSLFASCNFLLLGFDDKEEIDGGSALKIKLGKLIRRGRGTIYWDIHPSTTHIIVNDNCHTVLTNAANIVTTHHPNLPSAVSPTWIVESWKNQTLKRPQDFPPSSNQSEDSKQRNEKKTSDASTKKKEQKQGASVSATVFRGCMFAVVRIAPPQNAVDFDSKHLEQMILRNGGQMVSLKLLDALRVDAARASNKNKNMHQQKQLPSTSRNDNGQKRTCHVVCWGGFSSTHLSLNPILAQLQRHNLCKLLLVTPIWLQTCVEVQKRIPPHRLPVLFTPQAWMFRRLHYNSTEENQHKEPTSLEKTQKDPTSKTDQALEGKTTQDQATVCACVTGFTNSERVAIRLLLHAIGATYDSNMSRNCTHLICKDQDNPVPGPKLDRAIEQGVAVVSIDWLYQMARTGSCCDTTSCSSSSFAEDKKEGKGDAQQANKSPNS